MLWYTRNMKKVFFILHFVGECKKMSEKLPKHIVEHCEKLHLSEKLTASLFAYSKLELLLKKFNKSLDDLSFTENGKPILKEGFVSISHTDDWVLVSYSEENHGLDIEKIKTKENINKLVSRYFPKLRESHEFDLLDEKSQNELFYSWWTRKEAYVKMVDGNVLSYDELEMLDSSNKYQTYVDGNIVISFCLKDDFVIEKVY